MKKAAILHMIQTSEVKPLFVYRRCKDQKSSFSFFFNSYVFTPPLFLDHCKNKKDKTFLKNKQRVVTYDHRSND